MFNNPLIERFRYSLMRPRQFWIYVGIYATVAILMLLITFSAFMKSRGLDIEGFSSSLFTQFATFQILILWIWTSVNVGSAIRDEIRDKSYDFFKLLPLPAWKKAVGILVGKNLVAHLLGIITFVFIVPCALGASISMGSICELIFLIVTVSIFFNLVALLATTQQRQATRHRSSSALAIVFFGFFAIGPFISIVAALLDTDGIQSFTIPFFVWEARGLILLGCFALYFSAWLFKGVCRQFRFENAPLFTLRGGVGFVCAMLVLLLGLFTPHFEGDAQEACVSFWAISLALSGLMAIAAFRPFNSYIEDAAQAPGHSDGLWQFVLKRSNLRIPFMLIGLCLAVGIPCGIVCEIPPALVLLWIFTLAEFSLFFSLLFELYMTYRPVSPKLHILLLFVALLHIILPLILAGVFANKDLVACSPVGYLGVLLDNRADENSFLLAVPVLNLLLCVGALLPIKRRYRSLLNRIPK